MTGQRDKWASLARHSKHLRRLQAFKASAAPYSTEYERAEAEAERKRAARASLRLMVAAQAADQATAKRVLKAAKKALARPAKTPRAPKPDPLAGVDLERLSLAGRSLRLVYGPPAGDAATQAAVRFAKVIHSRKTPARDALLTASQLEGCPLNGLVDAVLSMKGALR
jgi:hypothetical protein